MTEHRRPLYRGRAGLSEREYAAHAGISRGAVQKARASGRLVLHADGSIDAAASDTRRTQATDPSMQRGRRQPSLRPVPEAAVGAVTETLREQGLPAPAAAGGMTYLRYDPADVLTLTWNDGSTQVPFYVTEIAFGADGVLELKGAGTDEVVYLDSTAPGSGSTFIGQSTGAIEPATLALMDLPPLRDADDDLG